MFLRSMTQASFSPSMPSLSWIVPSESERVTTLAPSSQSFCAVYCATFPDPETAQVLPWNPSPFVLSISSQK